jgi:hypothetical protein
MVVGLAAPPADPMTVCRLSLPTIELDIDLVPAPVGRSRARWPVSRAAVEPR